MPPPSYRCVLFDLDHTLWDYETNSAETLGELYTRYDLAKLAAAPFTSFLETFISINGELWDRYDRGLIHRDVIRFERFHRILTAAGVDNYDLSLRFSHDYITESPLKKKLLPRAVETLDYLAARYSLYIITNGFEEVQSTKLRSSEIDKYFKNVITSERAGHRKPAREIFDYALSENGFRAHEAVMVGDNLLTDILGARNAEIDHVFFNPTHAPHREPVTYEIHDLGELRTIL